MQLEEYRIYRLLLCIVLDYQLIIRPFKKTESFLLTVSISHTAPQNIWSDTIGGSGGGTWTSPDTAHTGPLSAGYSPARRRPA